MLLRMTAIITVLALQGCTVTLDPAAYQQANAEQSARQDAARYYENAIQQIEQLEPSRSGLKTAEELRATGRQQHASDLWQTEEGYELYQRFREAHARYRNRAAVAIGRQAIAAIEKLPATAASVDEAREIVREAREYTRSLPMEHPESDLDGRLWDTYKRLSARVAGDQCSQRLPGTGLPQRVRDLEVWGVHANAVQYRSTFRTLFCAALRGTENVTYLAPTSGSADHGIQFDRGGRTVRIRFSPLGTDPAWVVDRVEVDGAPQGLTSQDKIGLLHTLRSM